MPILKSAKKALKVSRRRRKENLRNNKNYKTAIKAVNKAVSTGGSNLEELLKKAKSSVDKAAKTKTIHQNKAARIKSRLAKKIASTKKS